MKDRKKHMILFFIRLNFQAILHIPLFPYYYISYWLDYFILKGNKNIKKAKAYINSEDDVDLKDLFNKISK